MRMDEVIIILSRILFIAEYFGAQPTGGAIAKSLTWSWSRATTYRKLSKMQSIGIIECIPRPYGNIWYLTEKGQEFWRNYHELPL